MPGIGQWVAPTLDPAEIEKRISELRTVQYWLEQNARMLAATIQALEVQRMTLSTLKTMNVQMADLGESLKIKPVGAGGRAGRRARPRRRRAAKKAAPTARSSRRPGGRSDAVVGRAHQPVRPARDQRDEGQRADAAKALAGNLVKQSFDTAAAGDEDGRRRAGEAAAAAGAAEPRRRTPAARRRRSEARRASAAAAASGAAGARRPRSRSRHADERAAARRRRLAAAAPAAVDARDARPKWSPRSARPCPRTRCSGAREDTVPYECDGLTAYREQPLVVALPETERQVAEVLAICHRLEVPVVARGAGTGLSGGALPDPLGVTLSLAKFNRIVAIDRAARTATVQSGVRNLAISEAAAPYGLYYAPDPSSQIACTIGGNVAENSGGVHCLKYGLTLHNVLKVRGFTVDGEPVEFGGDALDRPGLDLLAAGGRQRGHARGRHRGHGQAAAQAADGALHHGQLRRRAARPATRSPRSSPPASSRPAWR